MRLTYDPEIAAALAALPPDPPPLPRGEWRRRRELIDVMAARMVAALPVPDGVEVEHAAATAQDGAAIALRIYRPTERPPSGGTVLYLHGGGHFCCGVETLDTACRWYAADSGATLVSVDYRFAPEHPFPVGIEDAYAALQWTAEHTPQLGGHAGRLAVMGDSAGGGMAAGLALLARDRGGPALVRQLLVYPMLDDRTTVPDPVIEPLLTWGYDDNATGWQALLGDLPRGQDVSPYAAPARATDLVGLPPAYIDVGQLDAFRDEDVDYAMRLSRVGVEVELHVRAGAPHDFETIAWDAQVTRRAAADRARVLASI